MKGASEYHMTRTVMVGREQPAARASNTDGPVQQL